MGEVEPTRWQIFLQLLKICGDACYILCPPVPELITRKLAFHPPQKGLTYEIVLENGTKVGCASKLLGQKFQMKLTNSIKELAPAEMAEGMDLVEPFTVTTQYNNTLVGVKISPVARNSSSSSPGTSPSSAEQPNSSDLGHMLHPAYSVLQRMACFYGVEIFAYDYSGYGLSTGAPSEKNIYADLQAIYQYVRKTRPNARIILVGFSIGTTASIHLAAQSPEKLAGVVLLAAFWSGLFLLRNRTDRSKEVAEYVDRFRNIDRIGLINVPVLLIHGADDELVPIQQSIEMHKMLKKPVTPLYVYGATHTSIFSMPATFQRIYRFLMTETEMGSNQMSASLQ